MRKIYRLKKDLPWLAAGAKVEIGVDEYSGGTDFTAYAIHWEGKTYTMPKAQFDEWFELPSTKFSRAQVEAIEKVIPRYELDPGGNRVRLRLVADLYDFLDKNTES